MSGAGADKDRKGAIQLRAVTKRYGEERVVDRIDLAIRPGVQWISHPDAGIPDERYRDDARLRDAVVLELRLAAKL